MQVVIDDKAGDGFDYFAFLFEHWLIGFEETPSRPALETVFFGQTASILEAGSNDSVNFNGQFTVIGETLVAGQLETLVFGAEQGIVAAVRGLQLDPLSVIEAFDAIAISSDFTLYNSLFFEDATINGSINDDVLRGFVGDDMFFGGAGADQFDGAEGVDTVDYASEGGDGAIDVNLAASRARNTFGERETLTSIENIVGSSGDDTIFGDDEANFFRGGAGNDDLNTKGGDDVVFAGAGDDRLTGGTGDDELSGDDGDDVLGGRSGDDTLLGGEGDDRLFGQLGDDDIDAGFGDDVVNGGVGDDTIDAGFGDDRVLARDGDDVILGGFGDDRLNGGTGEDRLNGASGDDTLIGGADGDVFVYDQFDFGVDRLVRFNPNLDIIEIGTFLVSSFEFLSIEQVDQNVEIDFAGGTIVIVARDVDDVTEADFLFV